MGQIHSNHRSDLRINQQPAEYQLAIGLGKFLEKFSQLLDFSVAAGVMFTYALAPIWQNIRCRLSAWM